MWRKLVVAARKAKREQERLARLKKTAKAFDKKYGRRK